MLAAKVYPTKCAPCASRSSRSKWRSEYGMSASSNPLTCGSDESRDEVKAKALWQLSARLTGSAGSVVEDLHRLGQQRELRGDGHI